MLARFCCAVVVLLVAAGCTNGARSETSATDGSAQQRRSTATSQDPHDAGSSTDGARWATEACETLLDVQDVLATASEDEQTGNPHPILVELADSLDVLGARLSTLAAQAPSSALEATFSQLAERADTAAASYAAVSERTTPADFESEDADDAYGEVANSTEPAAFLLVRDLYDFVVYAPEYAELSRLEVEARTDGQDQRDPSEPRCAVLTRRMVITHE